MFCRQRHRGVWTGIWSNAGYTEGLCHGRLLKTEGSKKRREGEKQILVLFGFPKQSTVYFVFMTIAIQSITQFHLLPKLTLPEGNLK